MDLKTLEFTEFVPTQEMLRRFLTERGFSMVCLNGSMGMEERQRLQEAFAREVRHMSTPVPVGFSQRLQLDWLEHTAMLILAGHTRAHVVTALQDLLRHELSIGGTAPRGNREKAITMLLQIWVATPRHLRPFRDEGLAHVQRLPVDDRIAVHWGMAMAVYPFFGAVAEAVGRLVRLQGTCAAAHVQRRIREQLGERETVARAVRRTLRCFVNWGTLLETGERGVYQAAPARPVQDKKLVVWFTEAALLTSRVHTGGADSAGAGPCAVPFPPCFALCR